MTERQIIGLLVLGYPIVIYAISQIYKYKINKIFKENQNILNVLIQKDK